MPVEEKNLAVSPAPQEDERTQQELLRSLAEQSAIQTVMARKQLNLTRLSTIFVGVMAAAVVLFVGAALPKVNSTLANADSVLQSMAEVTRQLEEADLTGILDNLDRTLNEGQQSLQDASKALEKVSQIDFDSLNQAIRDLRQLLENPLGAIFS